MLANPDIEFFSKDSFICFLTNLLQLSISILICPLFPFPFRNNQL